MCLDCVDSEQVEETIESYYKKYNSHTTLLFESVEYGRLDIFRELISRGADVNCKQDGIPIVQYVANSCSLDMVKELIQSGCICRDPDDFYSWTGNYNASASLVAAEYQVQHGEYSRRLEEVVTKKSPGPEVVSYILDFQLEAEIEPEVDLDFDINEEYNKSVILAGRY